MTAQQFTPSNVVVAGCDGSWQSLAAVRTAVREAAARVVGVVLLAVARPTAGSRLMELREAEEEAVARALATVKRAADVVRTTDPAVPVETLVVLSMADPRVDALADRSILLVLGNHGGGGQSAFSLASTSAELAHRLPVPLLVPGTQDPAPLSPAEQVRAQVKVAFRPDRDQPDLLRLAAREAALRHTGLEVVAATRAGTRDGVSATQHAVWHILDTVPECAAIPTHVMVVEGPVRTALLLGARPGDLLVVGTRGGGTLAGLVRDSVARQVLDGAPCDVLVLPSGVRVKRVEPSRESPARRRRSVA